MILFYPNENSSAHFNHRFSFVEKKKRIISFRNAEISRRAKVMFIFERLVLCNCFVKQLRSQICTKRSQRNVKNWITKLSRHLQSRNEVYSGLCTAANPLSSIKPRDIRVTPASLI